MDFYKFGKFVFRPHDYVLTRDGSPVSLTPKMFEVLLVLVRNRGRILGKDDLMKAVWIDTVVEEGNLAVIVRQLRKALDDDAHNPTYIETVSRRGYRFIADVEIEHASGNLSVAAVQPPSSIENARSFPTRSEVQEYDQPRHSPPVVALADWRADQHANGAAETSSPPSPQLELVPPRRRGNWRSAYLAGGLFVAVLIAAGFYIFGSRVSRLWTDRLVDRIGVLSAEKLTEVGNVNVASISPDGKMLAYGTTEAGKHIIWLRQLATGKSLQIIPPTDEAITSISFSHDGEHLNYVGRRPGEDAYLNTIPILGGQPVRLVSGVHGYSFSPDGRSIAFTRFSHQGSGFNIAAADGSNERTVLEIPPPRYVISLSWSPDGKAIAYGLGKMNSRDNDFELMEVDIQTGEQRPLTQFRWNVIEKVLWLPDNSGILLSGRDAPDINDQMWKVSLPGGEAQQISFDSSSLYLYGASADFKKIVASQSVLDTQVWISSGGPGSAPQPTMAAQFDLAMTPDGRVIFPAKDSVGADLWMMNRDGSGRRQLTQDASIERNPAVSPDGNFLVYVSGNRGRKNIWRMNFAGGSAIQLTHGDGEHYPTFTSDGRYVLYNSIGDGSVWKVPVEGGEPVKVLGERAMRVSVSPDGKSYAYFGRKDGVRKLLVRSMENGSLLHAFDATVWIASPPRVLWDKSGRSIIYQSGGSSDVGNLMQQPLDGSPPKQLTDFTSLQIFDYCVSPSGDFAFVRGVWKFDVVLLSSTK
jgi:Tol biopolymer transport system component/DNA-binding winged helix-turn-helix (wHTH) protein